MSNNKDGMTGGFLLHTLDLVIQELINISTNIKVGLSRNIQKHKLINISINERVGLSRNIQKHKLIYINK